MTNGYLIESIVKQENRINPYVQALVGLLILTGLYFAILYSFLLFHSLAEIFSILVAFSVFIIAWNSRRTIDNNYLFLIGVAYLAIGFLDLMHTFAYKGMGIIPDYGGNSATQLWIGTRYLESLSLLGGLIFMKKRLSSTLLIFIYLATAATILLMIFYWHIFPNCFVPGSGLTPFKVGSEYAISAVLLIAVGMLWKRRFEFDRFVFTNLFFSILMTVLSELAFTFYVSVYGLSNLLGHFFKMISFYLVYRAIVETGLRKPYDLIYRKLKTSEHNLKCERDQLKKKIQEIKVLSGLLPICAYCNKIRDDSGYWNQLETYINEHSMAKFSHSVCPDCEVDFFKNYNQRRFSQNDSNMLRAK